MGFKTRPQGCWGRATTLGRVPNGPNLIHGPLGQNKVTQHLGQKNSPTQIEDSGRLGEDMAMILDPSESRLDKLSIKCLNAQNGVRMKSWRPLQVDVVAQSESSRVTIILQHHDVVQFACTSPSDRSRRCWRRWRRCCWCRCTCGVLIILPFLN